MLITTVSAPVQPCRAKGPDDKSCPEEPSHSAALDTVRSELIIEQTVEKIPEKLLARPSDNATWRRYLVRAHQLEPLLPFFENILSVHIVGKTSNDKHYDVVVCDSYVLLLQYVGCTFKFLSEDVSVDVAPTDSTAPEFVHVNSANCNDSSGIVHVGPTESAESDEFVLVEHTDYSLSTESAEPTTKPVKYKDFVSVTGDVVFVELFDKVKKSLKTLHYDVSQPRQGEINVYGCATAKEQAENRFVMNAMRAVSSGKHGQGLDRYYLSSLDYHNARSLRLAVEWAIFIREGSHRRV